MTAASPDPDGTRVDVEAITARVEAATEGPWEAVRVPFRDTASHSIKRDKQVLALVGWEREEPVRSPADAEFIAHARTDVPALLAEVERLRGTVGLADDHAVSWRARAESAEARVAAVEHDLDVERERIRRVTAVADQMLAELLTVRPEPVGWRNIHRDLRAALAHATPSDAPQGEGEPPCPWIDRPECEQECMCLPEPVADRDAVRLSEEERDAIGLAAESDEDRRHADWLHLFAVVECILTARLAAHAAPGDAPHGAGEREGWERLDSVLLYLWSTTGGRRGANGRQAQLDYGKGQARAAVERILADRLAHDAPRGAGAGGREGGSACVRGPLTDEQGASGPEGHRGSSGAQEGGERIDDTTGGRP